MMSKLLSLLLSSLIAFSPLAHAISDVDKQDISSFSVIKNGGFENSKIGWTASGGTFSVTTTAANVGFGKVAASWNSNAAAQTLSSTQIAIPSGLGGRNAVISCILKADSGTATHRLEAFDGTNVIEGATVSSSTSGFIRTSVNFIAPLTGTIGARLLSVNADEPLVYFDGCYLGPADGFNLSSVSQPTFIGEGYIAETASCSWDITTTGTTHLDFPTTAACPGPTVVSNPGQGTLQTTDTDLPQFTFNGLSPGRYEVYLQGSALKIGTDGVTGLAVSDGTTVSGIQGGPRLATVSAQQDGFSIVGSFVYTELVNKTFKLQAFAQTNGIRLLNDSAATGRGRLSIQLKRFPLTSELAYRPEQFSQPTIQKFTSGSGTYTKPTGVSHLRVRAVGGGGGGAGGGNSGSAGTGGGTTTFGSSFLTATGGAAGNGNGGSGGVGGTATIGSGGSGTALSGGQGDARAQGTGNGDLNTVGGMGGVSAFGGSGGSTGANGAGAAAAVNSGSGGGGGGGSTVSGGSGGGAGGFIDAIIAAPSVSYSYSVGTGGGGGSPSANGQSGGAGGSGYIEVTEFYGAVQVPVLVGSVTSSSTGAERIERATIAEGANCTTGACVISRQSGSWLTSATRTTTGVYNLVFAPSVFGGAPTCSASHWNGYCLINQSPFTSTTGSINCRDTGGDNVALDARDIHLICMGQK